MHRVLLVALPLLVCGTARAQDAWDLPPVVRGFVEAEGAAVADATVSLVVVGEPRTVVRWKLGGGLESQRSFEPLLGVAATTTSDANGRFVLRPQAWTRAGRHRYRLIAKQEDLGLGDGREWDPTDVSDETGTTFVLRRGVVLEGLLVDADDRPVPDAELVGQGGISGRMVAPCVLDRLRTDRNGRFRTIAFGGAFPGYGFACAIRGETFVLDHRDRTRTAGSVEVWRLPRPAGERCSVDDGWAVGGVRSSTLRVVDGTGAPVPAFSVARTSDPWRPGYAWRSYADGVRCGGKSLRIDGDGPLHVFAPGFTPALFVDGRPDESGALVVRLNAGAVVRGRVVDRDGFGISGAMVELADAAEPLDAFVSARVGRVRSRGPWAETDDFGGFELRYVPAGRWRIRAGARGFAPAESPVLRTLGEEIHVVPSIALPDAAAIVVRGGDDGFTATVDASRSFAQFPASASTRLDLAPGTVVRLQRNLVGCLMSDSCTTTVPAEGDVVVTLP